MEASLSRFCSRFCISLLAGNNLKSVLPFCAFDGPEPHYEGVGSIP